MTTEQFHNKVKKILSKQNTKKIAEKLEAIQKRVTATLKRADMVFSLSEMDAIVEFTRYGFTARNGETDVVEVEPIKLNDKDLTITFPFKRATNHSLLEGSIVFRMDKAPGRQRILFVEKFVSNDYIQVSGIDLRADGYAIPNGTDGIRMPYDPPVLDEDKRRVTASLSSMLAVMSMESTLVQSAPAVLDTVDMILDHLEYDQGVVLDKFERAFGLK